MCANEDRNITPYLLLLLYDTRTNTVSTASH